MKFAYADPPYPGQAYQYADHPDYAGEVDHRRLIDQLERDYPDGWALSTNGSALQNVLSLCPHVRVAIWHKTNAAPPGGRSGWWWDWEPLIVRGGRPGPARAVLSCGISGRSGRFLGAKPPAFTRWMLDLLGAEPADQIDDLFPGSGAVGHAIESWRRQPRLPMFVRGEVERLRKTGYTDRDLRLAGQPDLFQTTGDQR